MGIDDVLVIVFSGDEEGAGGRDMSCVPTPPPCMSNVMCGLKNSLIDEPFFLMV